MIPGDIYSHTEIICWELVPAACWCDLLSSQLSVVTWDKGLSLVTGAVGKMSFLYSVNQLIWGPLGQVTYSFLILQISWWVTWNHARYQLSLLELRWDTINIKKLVSFPVCEPVWGNTWRSRVWVNEPCEFSLGNLMVMKKCSTKILVLFGIPDDGHGFQLENNKARLGLGSWGHILSLLLQGFESTGGRRKSSYPLRLYLVYDKCEPGLEPGLLVRSFLLANCIFWTLHHYV